MDPSSEQNDKSARVAFNFPSVGADPDASCYCGETGGDPQPRIMEGEAANIRETPWVVRLWLLSRVGNRSSFAAKR